MTLKKANFMNLTDSAKLGIKYIRVFKLRLGHKEALCSRGLAVIYGEIMPMTIRCLKRRIEILPRASKHMAPKRYIALYLKVFLIKNFCFHCKAKWNTSSISSR